MKKILLFLLMLVIKTSLIISMEKDSDDDSDKSTKNCHIVDSKDSSETEKEPNRKEMSVFVHHVLDRLNDEGFEIFYVKLSRLIIETKKDVIEAIFQEKVDSIGIEQSPLIIALFYGCCNLAKTLIAEEKERGKINMSIGRLKLTPLFIAVILKSDELVKELIKGGADVNAKDSETFSVLMHAAPSGYQIVSTLIKSGADINYRCNNGAPFLMAAIDADPRMVQKIVREFDIDVNCTDDDRKTALMCAITDASEDQKIELVKFFISRDAKVNEYDSEGYTALMLVIKSAIIKINEVDSEDKTDLTLVNTKAKARAKTRATARNKARKKERIRARMKALIQVLVSAGANINAKNAKNGITALILSVREPLILDDFIKFGPNLDIQDNEENTALIYAASAYPDSVKKLIDAGADVNIVNREGKNALIVACCECDQVITLLIGSGKIKDINYRDHAGKSALVYAFAFNICSIGELMDAGADVESIPIKEYREKAIEIYKMLKHVRFTS